jgi:lactate dehydrogenase-like 2-hydroxyacid dehydrogenase
MHKIVFLDRATIARQIVLRRPGFEHVWIEHEHTSTDDVGERLADSVLMRLLERPDFILTPHVARASTEAQQTLADQLIDNIENFASRTPSNVVLGSF